ncbi:MAG: hypothetical protein K2N85_11150 [Lachnospiraceae bacterium]|nr:hypothetical protein [Lachnospiraceae bacterium]
MLKKLEKKDFDKYVEFAYELALDMTKSGYPTYADGIKTKNDFITRESKAFSRNGEEILLFERDGKVTGWIHYYHLLDDHYLGTTSFCVAEGMREAVTEFTVFAREHFPGSDLYLGFPKENTEAVEALNACGFECIEESYNNVMNFEQYIQQPESADVIPITRENFQLFADIHSQYDDDMYWTSQRILNAIDGWRIFVFLREGKAAGAIYSRIFEDKTMSEIFGVDFPDGIYDGKVYRELLTAALNDEKRRGTKHMVFFCDEESQSDALACGFHCVGEYVCFQKKL